MHNALHSPKPLRLFQSSAVRIDSACDTLPKRKHCRLSSSPSSSPSLDAAGKVSVAPGDYHRESLSRPVCKRKRDSEDARACGAPARRQRLSQSPTSPLSSAVYEWVSQLPRPDRVTLPRPDSAPPRLFGALLRDSFIKPAKLTSAALARAGIAQADGQQPASTDPSQSAGLGTSDPLYRSVIDLNNITLDLSGREIDNEIQELLDTYILKRRDSPPLTNAEVFEVVDKATELIDCAEGMATYILETKAFPMGRRHICDGRNLQWTSDALPSNPEYPYRLSAPKPNRHYGYPRSSMSGWTTKEMAVVDHATARPYAQPTIENMFPFLMLEVKSEAAGGVLYAAENQAVGSGVHSVSSLRWLLQEACPAKIPVATDAVAFTGAVSPRAAVFYIVWFCDKKKRYVMSKFRDVSFLNGPKRPDVQDCRNIMKNVLDYGVDVRQKIIKKALAQLNPIPLQWGQY